MAELVEGARLEIVFTRNSNQGSNPCLSAIKDIVSRLKGVFLIYRLGFSFFSLRKTERKGDGDI